MTIRPKYETASRHNKVTRPKKAARKAAYETVAKRAGGRCEACNAVGVQIHHRLYRSRGGEDALVNLLALCLEHHGIAHTAVGEARGWSVRSGYDPATVPVLFPDGSWWRLLEDGTRARTNGKQ